MIAESACDFDIKERILRKFKQRHRARRQPILAQLVLIQGCVGVDRPGASDRGEKGSPNSRPSLGRKPENGQPRRGIRSVPGG